MEVTKKFAAALLFLMLLGGCGGGDDGDTTINQTTTVISTVPATTSTTESETPIETPSNQEFTGPCEGSREPTPTRTGFADIEVVEAPCEYAVKVATAFADAYGPHCFGGCTQMVEGIRCETRPTATSEVLCSAARTEVRFLVSGED